MNTEPRPQDIVPQAIIHITDSLTKIIGLNPRYNGPRLPVTEIVAILAQDRRLHKITNNDHQIHTTNNIRSNLIARDRHRHTVSPTIKIRPDLTANLKIPSFSA